jgi:polyisoprenoid-binding protein YceI
MTRTQVVLFAAVLTVTLCASAAAQGTSAMAIRPESELTIAGGSNLHDWACTTKTLRATIEVDSNFATMPLTQVDKPIAKVSVAIPVKSLKCGKGKMDENLYKALRADDFPDITYVLMSYNMDKTGTTADKFSALTVGELTVAGTTTRVEIPLNAERLDGGAARGEGTLALKMTDVGIKPPTALLGTLRTKNEITIRFQVLLDKDTAVALSQ